MTTLEGRIETIEELREKVQDFTWAFNRIVELLVEEGGEAAVPMTVRAFSRLQHERDLMLETRRAQQVAIDIPPPCG